MESMLEEVRKKLIVQKQTGRMFLAVPYNINLSNPRDRVWTMMLEGTCFIDYYKELCYKVETHTLTNNDRIFLSVMEKITRFEEIHPSILGLRELFAAMVLSSCHYHEASILEKLAQIKSLRDDNVMFLQEIFPPFIEEKEIYEKPIELEVYYRYYMHMRKFYEEKNMHPDMETYVNEIKCFIQKLYTYQEKEATRNIMDLVIIDHQAGKRYEDSILSSFGNGLRKRKTREAYVLEEDTILLHALSDEYYLEELVDVYIGLRKMYATKEEFEEVIELEKARMKRKEK